MANRPPPKNVFFRPFEPDPTVVLAGIGALLATLAAPHGAIILVSQRAEQRRDRVRSRNGCLVNLKAELEIRYLSEQVQLLLDNQDQTRQKLKD